MVRSQEVHSSPQPWHAWGLRGQGEGGVGAPSLGGHLPRPVHTAKESDTTKEESWKLRK